MHGIFHWEKMDGKWKSNRSNMVPQSIIHRKLLLMSPKNRPKWVNFQDFFFILGSYFKSYLSDLRGKLLSYKIAHIFSVLLMYFSLKIFRKILGRDAPYVICCILLHKSDFYPWIKIHLLYHTLVQISSFADVQWLTLFYLVGCKMSFILSKLSHIPFCNNWGDI